MTRLARRLWITSPVDVLLAVGWVAAWVGIVAWAVIR